MFHVNDGIYLEGPTATAMVGGVWTGLFYDDTIRERLYKTRGMVEPQPTGVVTLLSDLDTQLCYICVTVEARMLCTSSLWSSRFGRFRTLQPLHWLQPRLVHGLLVLVLDLQLHRPVNRS